LIIKKNDLVRQVVFWLFYLSSVRMSQMASVRKTAAIPNLTAAACFLRKAESCLEVVP